MSAVPEQIAVNCAINVAVRIRPRTEKEAAADVPVYFSHCPRDQQVLQQHSESGSKVKYWPFKTIFGADSSNKMIFDVVGVPLVDAALEGYHAALLVYGQTTAGSTYSLYGDGVESGLLDLSMYHLQEKLDAESGIEYIIKMSFLEVYNDEIRDLLMPNPTVEELLILDDPEYGPYVSKVAQVTFTSPAEMKKVVQAAEANRVFGVTDMSAHHGQSHFLLRLTIESRKREVSSAKWGADRPDTISTLTFVNFASSEKSTTENIFLNPSMQNVNDLVDSLAAGAADNLSVLYASSKIIRLLSGALGGNCKTCLLTCISPAAENVQESLNTLRLATEAHHIVNLVHKNQPHTAIAAADLEHILVSLDSTHTPPVVHPTTKEEEKKLNAQLESELFVGAEERALSQWQISHLRSALILASARESLALQLVDSQRVQIAQLETIIKELTARLER